MLRKPQLLILRQAARRLMGDGDDALADAAEDVEDGDTHRDTETQRAREIERERR
jgi:hypothetical protein